MSKLIESKCQHVYTGECQVMCHKCKRCSYADAPNEAGVGFHARDCGVVKEKEQ
jgi:hypothetical protein